MAAMNVYSEVKKLYTSLQEMVGFKRRKRQMQISEPFNFKKETAVLPGLTETEISVLREKAAASRLGIAYADADPVVPTLALPRQSSRLSLAGSQHSHHNNGSYSGGGCPLGGGRGGSPAVGGCGRGGGGGGGGTNRPVSPLPLPRLSNPLALPIPIPHGGRQQRHGSSGGSSLRSSTTVGTGPAAGLGSGSTLGGLGAGMGMGAGMGLDRTSVSMNDLDLLLFGNPSGMGNIGLGNHTGGGGGGGGIVDSSEPATAILAPVSSRSAVSISPLDLDGAAGLDLLDMDFEFQLGSPVSPLTPSPGGVVAGRRGFVAA